MDAVSGPAFGRGDKMGPLELRGALCLEGVQDVMTWRGVFGRSEVEMSLVPV